VGGGEGVSEGRLLGGLGGDVIGCRVRAQLRVVSAWRVEGLRDSLLIGRWAMVRDRRGVLFFFGFCRLYRVTLTVLGDDVRGRGRGNDVGQGMVRAGTGEARNVIANVEDGDKVASSKLNSSRGVVSRMCVVLRPRLSQKKSGRE
jgi:hypothetical protein